MGCRCAEVRLRREGGGLLLKAKSDCSKTE